MTERDWRVVFARDLTDAKLALIALAEVPAEYAYLDAELKGWEPERVGGDSALWAPRAAGGASQARTLNH
jgi:hypothetical protein